MKNEFPNLHEIAMRFLLCFSTTYLCETAFSAMTVLKTEERNRLQHSDCLHSAVTSFRPRINKLTDRKQQQKYVLFTHQKMQFLLNLEKFKFT